MAELILIGDVFDKIKEIPNESIDLCITSPPYWGLRDYGVEGQLGNEPTMEAYLDNTIKWVKEVWRVLKPTGSFVLNIGDCFIGGGRGSKSISETSIMNKVNSSVPKPPKWNKLSGFYKTKQLLSVSSFAYCRIIGETDFVCRGEHLWCKPNVPSPIRSRLKHSHEKLFWFVKDADEYYFDAKAWTKPIKESSEKRKDTIEHSWREIPVGEKQKGFENHVKPKQLHVAPYPTKLIYPYILSLCPQDGTILDPFLGSGTTMRIAMENGRACVGIELNPEYADYAAKRCNIGNKLEEVK